MKRCYFLGMDVVFDAELVPQLYELCKQVVEENDSVEFWFYYGEDRSFVSSCLALVIHLKTNYPDRDVKIVRVFDPLKNDTPADWFQQAYNSSFPRCIPDKNVFAPAMDGAAAQGEHSYVQQAHKIERWILREMDLVFAYYYPNLEDSVIARIEYAQNHSPAEVKHLHFPKTEQIIQEIVDTKFDERTVQILKLFRENHSQREIGKAVGLSSTRVSQVAHKAARDVRYELMRRFGGKRVFKDRICGMCCLPQDATALQLVVFESLLEYLARKYQVKEFWIDPKSSDTPYGAALAKYCAYAAYGRPRAKVVVCMQTDDPDEWGKTIETYVPPFISVVNLGLESADWNTICEEMVRQCTCMVTDFASPDGQIVRDLCARSGQNYLFDIPKKEYQIDERFA